jgi:hypothetical protein
VAYSADMISTKGLFVLTVASVLVSGCGTEPLDLSEPGSIPEIRTPAGDGSGEPNLSIDNDGRVLLSWIEPAGEDGDRLRFATLDSRAMEWSSARSVAQGPNWFVNWADFPSVIPISGDRLAAHWLAKTGPDTYAYGVNVSLSGDGGQTWSEPIVPHGDGTQTEHGFVSMLPMDDGSVSAVWLDGREMAGDGGSGDMTLRHGFIRADGSVEADALLDDRVCECCQTSAARIPDGQIVVYRNRSEEEIRDISIVSYRDGQWSDPRALSNDGWQIHGCPVNGPSISASGNRVAVAWFTGANDEPRVSLVLSDDSGETFNDPIRIDNGNPLGRVEVLMLDRSAFVIWMEQTDEGAQVHLGQVDRRGTLLGSWVVTDTSEARSSGFPQLVGNSERVVLAWTDARRPSTIRTAVIALQGYSD